jgi:hypothetical protein
MIGPSWLADVLAAVVLSVALFSAGRLIASRRRQRQGEVDADGVHLLMGVAMAGMFVPSLATLPNPVWEVIFAGGAAWFAWRSVKLRRVSFLRPRGQCCEYPVPHLVDCLAMLYVLWAVRVTGPGAALGAGGMSAMAGGVRLPALALVLALCVCGYVVWLGDRIQLLTPAAITAASGGSGSSGMVAPAHSAAGISASAHDRDRFTTFSGGQSVAIMDSAALTLVPVPVPVPVPVQALVPLPTLVPRPTFGGGSVGDGGASSGGGDSSASAGRSARLAGHAQLAPRAATCCKIAMGVAMGVMLIDIL